MGHIALLVWKHDVGIRALKAMCSSVLTELVTEVGSPLCMDGFMNKEENLNWIRSW